MATRAALCNDCKTISRDIIRGRCADCRASYERKRGTRSARGYDAEYDAASRDPHYTAATHCATCGQPFTTDNPKTKGHSIAIRDGGQGSPIVPECRRCNYGWRRSGR